MFFSIIIPTYNRAEIIRTTLQSVISQTFSDYEVIVVDDGSTDNTEKIVNDFAHPAIHYFYKKNEERSIARNYGADRAKGEYLIFLDSDDKMSPDHLMAIHKFTVGSKVQPEFIFAGYKILRPDNTLLYEYGLSGPFDKRKLFYGNFLGCSSVIVKKSLFVNYYFNTDPNIVLFEDWELWLRITADHTLMCFPNKSIIMINHDGRSVLNYKAEEMDLRILHFKNHVLKTSPAIKNSFINRHTFLMGIYSYGALHLALSKKSRLAALKYLVYASACNPFIIFKRRFYGIIKQLF